MNCRSDVVWMPSWHQTLFYPTTDPSSSQSMGEIGFMVFRLLILLGYSKGLIFLLYPWLLEISLHLPQAPMASNSQVIKRDQLQLFKWNVNSLLDKVESRAVLKSAMRLQGDVLFVQETYLAGYKVHFQARMGFTQVYHSSLL